MSGDERLRRMQVTAARAVGDDGVLEEVAGGGQ